MPVSDIRQVASVVFVGDVPLRPAEARAVADALHEAARAAHAYQHEVGESGIPRFTTPTMREIAHALADVLGAGE